MANAFNYSSKVWYTAASPFSIKKDNFFLFLFRPFKDNFDLSKIKRLLIVLDDFSNYGVLTLRDIPLLWLVPVMSFMITDVLAIQIFTRV